MTSYVKFKNKYLTVATPSGCHWEPMCTGVLTHTYAYGSAAGTAKPWLYCAKHAKTVGEAHMQGTGGRPWEGTVMIPLDDGEEEWE